MLSELPSVCRTPRWSLVRLEEWFKDAGKYSWAFLRSYSRGKVTSWRTDCSRGDGTGWLEKECFLFGQSARAEVRKWKRMWLPRGTESFSAGLCSPRREKWGGQFRIQLPSIEHQAVHVSCSVVSDSLWPHGLQPSKLLCPWDFPGKNTGVGCHFLLQGIFPTHDWTWVSHITGRFFTSWATKKALQGREVCSECSSNSPSNRVSCLTFLRGWSSNSADVSLEMGKPPPSQLCL